MDKGNVDKHRRTMSGLKVQETQKWGQATARSRYGSPQFYSGASRPKDEHGPQDPGSKHGPGYNNDTSGWRYDGQGRKPRG
jgi:hypothetical protein